MEYSYKLYTLGCKVNQYDSNHLKSLLHANGFREAEENADLAFVNTCTVTNAAISKNKRALNLARQENPKAKLVLMGCWPKTDQDAKNDKRADFIWEVGGYENLMPELLRLVGVEADVVKVKTDIVSSKKARYFLKVQDGCEQFCSYCIIPFARGPLVSRPWQEVVNEARQAVASGFREIILSGVHLGLYGKTKNFQSGIGLYQLLLKLIVISGLERIRLSSIEATEVGDDLVQLMEAEPKMCRHLHMPLQSGADKILKLMNRPYTTHYFEQKVFALRQKMPDIAISTDVIVGFPGEAETDFLETCDFVKKNKFSRLHVFSFSAHKRTKAFYLPGHLEREAINIRANELRRIGKDLSQDYINSFKGRNLKVIIESQSDNSFLGKTEFYFDVMFKANDVIDWCGNDAGEHLKRRAVVIKQ